MQYGAEYTIQFRVHITMTKSGEKDREIIWGPYGSASKAQAQMTRESRSTFVWWANNGWGINYAVEYAEPVWKICD